MSDSMKQEIERVIAEDDPEELLGVVIEIAMAADDRPWAEGRLVQLAGHADTNVRGNAVIGLANLAARLGGLDRDRVAPALSAALADEKEYVREQAEAAQAMLREELGWD